jgi:uncharacterized protein (DUF1697 family)
MSNVYVAMLRGINVGGNNLVPMKDLAAMFRDTPCEKVQTYIQSGNVIFHTTPGLCSQVPAEVTALIQQRLGLKVPIILRTLAQMNAVAANNPFLPAGAPENELHVSFLADTPTQQSIELLDPHRSPPGQFQVRGQEVYLWLPKGVAGTKLTNEYFGSKLATKSTQRNWRTVTKLLALMQGST